MNNFLLITLLVLLLYYAISIAAGIYKARQQTASQYITAPKSTNWISLSLTLIATVVGGGMFFGVAQEGYEKGLIAFSLGIAYFTGSIVLGLLAPSLRQYADANHVTTLFGVVETLYPNDFTIAGFSLTLSKLFAVVCFFVFLLMLSAQFVAIGTYISFFTDTNFSLAVVIGSVSLAVISTFINGFIGGFTKDVFTDVIQMIFIFLGVGVIVYYLDLGHLGDQMKGLPADLFTLRASQLIEFFGALIFIPLTFFLRFDLWQRIITAKSDQQARLGFYISGLLSLVFFLFFCFLGLYARGIGVGESKFAGLQVIQQVVTTPVASGLAIAMFCAAIISTADTFLGVAGLSAAKSTLYTSTELENADARNSRVSVTKLRITTFIIGLLSIGLALLVQNIVDLFATAFGFLLIFFPSFVFGFLSTADQVQKHRAAKWSVISGMVVLIILTYPLPREAWLPAMVLSLIVYYLLMGRSVRNTPVP